MHYKYGEYFAETVRKLRAIIGRDSAPNESPIRRLIWKFEGTGSVLDIQCQRTRIHRTVRHATLPAIRLIHLLHEQLPGRVISKHCDWNWPAKSWDLTPCDYFLFGYFTLLIYFSNRQKIQDLKEDIIRVIDGIQQEVCKEVIASFVKRVWVCQQVAGGFLSDIIFYY